MDRPVFYVYLDENSEWRWSLIDTNGKNVADSAEGYASRRNVNRAIKNVKDAIRTATQNTFATSNPPRTRG